MEWTFPSNYFLPPNIHLRAHKIMEINENEKKKKNVTYSSYLCIMMGPSEVKVATQCEVFGAIFPCCSKAQFNNIIL